MACNDLIAAILAGTNKGGLINACRLDRLHKPLHLRIVPNAKGVIFERMQIGQVEIDDLLFYRSSGITGHRWLRRDLRTGESAALIHGRLLRGNLTLGLFVPRFGLLCLIGSGLAILGRSASAGFGGLVLFRGQLLLERLFLVLGRLVTGGGKIHHLAGMCRGGCILVQGCRLLGLLFGFGLFGSSRAGVLRDSGLRFIRRNCLFNRDRICHNRLSLIGSRLLQRGGGGGHSHLDADILFIV